jgi:probable rRNA maturation factor
MQVAVFNRQRTLEINPKKVATLVKELVAFEERSCDEVAIYFIGKAAMRRLHGQYFDDFSLTDCISFPLDAKAGLLGDVFVCPQVAIAYAAKNGLDPYLETTLYIVHGLLHLMGYDDITEKDCKKMRAAEKRLLSHLEKRRLTL